MIFHSMQIQSFTSVWLFSLLRVSQCLPFESGSFEIRDGRLDIPVHWVRSNEVGERSTGVTANVTAALISPGHYSSYLSQVSVGTPAQNFLMHFDTGSSDFWLFSNQLAPSANPSHVPEYTPTASSQLPSATFDIKYESGEEATGPVYVDKVAIGSATATATIGAATALVSITPSNQNSGVFGLANTGSIKVNGQSVKTWYDNLEPSLALSVFAVDLNYNLPSSYTFGYINKTNAQSSLTYLPRDMSLLNQWFIAPQSFVIGGTVYPDPGTSKSTTDWSVDTGTSTFDIPTSILKDYIRLPQVHNGIIDSNGYLNYSCSATLPDIGVVFNQQTFTVPGSYLFSGAADSSTKTCLAWLKADDNLTILGDAFLRAFLVAFDTTSGNNRVGFAPKHLDTAPTPPASLTT